MVENAFGMLTNKWGILHRPLDVICQFCDNIVKACCMLHNSVRRNDRFQLEDTSYERNFERIQATGTRENTKGKHVTDYCAKYFTSPHGAAPWQYD